VQSPIAQSRFQFFGVEFQSVKKENKRYPVFGNLWQVKDALLRSQRRKKVGQHNHTYQAEEKTVNAYFCE
jgi:hypothetical protein